MLSNNTAFKHTKFHHSEDFRLSQFYAAVLNTNQFLAGDSQLIIRRGSMLSNATVSTHTADPWKIDIWSPGCQLSIAIASLS